jgi:DNA polymerase-4
VATILHVDMDAFFAAVEVLFDPSLKGLPVVVGGAGRRGVVAAASYEARRFGVRSAMAASQARRLCPQAVFLSGHYDRYTEISAQIHEIFHAYTPLVEGVALDEAFLDVTGALGRLGDGAVIGRRIRDQLHAEVHLWASVGVASSKLIAKLASEAAKPRAAPAGIERGAGVVVVAPDEELAFLHRHPVEAMWGVGPVTAAKLRGLGVATVGDLAAVPVETLCRHVGGANGRQLHELAWARDHRRVESDRAVQSIGHEETYPWDRADRAELEREIVRLSDSVAARLRTAGVAGRTVTLKLRYGDFTTITRSHTVRTGIDTGPAIARAARWLLEQVPVSSGVRLLGVSVANLAPDAPHQLTLALGRDDAAGDGEGSWRQATRAVDQVRARFGSGAVGPASLLEDRGLRMNFRGEHQWGPSGDTPGDPNADR